MGQIVKKHKWALIYLGIVLIAAVFVIYKSYFGVQNPKAFEVITFQGDVQIYSANSHAWMPAQRGQDVGLYDKIKTGEKSDIDFKLPGKALFRLQANSIAVGQDKEFFASESRGTSDIILQKGMMLSYILDGDSNDLIAATKEAQLSARGGSLILIESAPELQDPKTWVGVLKGSAKVTSKVLLKESLTEVKPLHKVEVTRTSGVTDPERVTRKEWGYMKDGYELIERVAPLAKDQLDLSKGAGNLFDKIFDHGTFYTPKVGYATREFKLDPNSGEVHLVIDYDVFPTGSFVGMYMKTRSLDISKFEALQFDAKVSEEDGYPDRFKLELKSKGNVVRSFTPRDFKRQWTTQTVDLNIKEDSMPLDEITFVFANDRVGEYKMGTLRMKNLRLIPKKPEEKITPPYTPETPTDQRPPLELDF